MKKRLFYNIGIKYLVAVLLLVAAIFTGILGSWVLAGLACGFDISEIADPVPYEQSSMAASYLFEQGEEMVDQWQKSKIYCADGSTYDGTATVDISNLDAGVANQEKNKNLEYRLDDLNNFYGTDEYWLLNELVNNGESFADPDAEYEYEEADDDGEDEGAAVEAPAVETPEPLGPEAKPFDYLNIYVSRPDEDGMSTDDIPVRIKRYRELYNVLYHNGIELEKKAIQTAHGTTIADYAQKNQDTVSIRDSYVSLLDAASWIHAYAEQMDEGSNALVYLRNTETGECYTNVPAWKNLTLEQVAADYEKTYTSDQKTYALYNGYDDAEGFYIDIDTLDTGSGRADRVLGDYCRRVLEYWQQLDAGNQTGQVFLGLNTAYPVNDSAKEDQEMLNWYQEKDLFLGSLLGGVNVFVPLIAGMAAIVFLLILLACQTGHRPEDKEVHLAPIDYFPLEILMAADVILWILMLAGAFVAIESGPNSGGNVYTNAIIRYPYFQAAFSAAFAGAVALFAWDLKHYGRRIKAKNLGGSIISSAGKAIQKAAAEFYRARKENQKLMFFYIGFVAIQFVVLGIAALFAFAGNLEGIAVFLVILLIIFDIYLLTRLLKATRGRDEVKKGMEAVASGNLDYQIDIASMSGANREMAEQINNMRDGLRQAVEAEMKSERLKTDLITNVSHDIKTPLTSIINYVDILKRAHIEDEKIAGYIDVLDRKSQRLKQLTEDLVEASKISSGNIMLEMQEINLKQLIKQTNGEFEEKFAAKNLDLICDLPESEMLIRADGRRMFRVIENLYNNAAKYAMPNSRVYVNGELKGGKVIFSMKNMSESPLNFKADELMERFVRGDVSRSTEGSGLGLEIARNLTVMQEGTFDLYLDGDLFKVTITFDAI